MYRRVLSRAPLPRSLQAVPLCKANKALVARVTAGECSCVAHFVTPAQCQHARQQQQEQQQQEQPQSTRRRQQRTRQTTPALHTATAVERLLQSVASSLPRSFHGRLGDVAEVAHATTLPALLQQQQQQQSPAHPHASARTSSRRNAAATAATTTAAALQHHVFVGVGNEAQLSVRDYRAAVTAAVRRAQAVGAAGVVLVPPSSSSSSATAAAAKAKRRTGQSVVVCTQADLFHTATPLTAEAVVERTATFAVTASYAYNRLRTRHASAAAATASSSSSTLLPAQSADDAADAAADDVAGDGRASAAAAAARRRTTPAADSPFALLIDTDDVAAVRTGSIIGRCVNDARTLVNLRQDECTPEFVVAWARHMLGATRSAAAMTGSSKKQQQQEHVRRARGRRHGGHGEDALNVHGDIHIRALLCGEAIRRAGMQLLYNVGKGSTHAPYVLVLEYVGNPRRDTCTMLVGKGVTFDSGGLNVKPYGSMETMHTDMAGAAVTLSALRAAAALQLPVNVAVAVGLVENAVGPDSYHPSCILTSLRGDTVEVLNTDAEGRLVLADVLTYVQQHRAPLRKTPQTIIDVATLTGAVVASLGVRRAGVLSRDAALMRQLCAAGMHVGEELWPLPVGEEHTAVMRGHLADWGNAARGSKHAGASTAAAFLAQFVDRHRAWAHVDIAGTADVGDRPRGFHPGGATGYGVQLLVEYLRRL